MKIEENFRSKIQRLGFLFPSMIQEIKKNIKTELFKKYPKVYQKHFSRMHFAKCTHSELAKPLLQEVLEGNEDIAEWLSSLWMTKNREIYHFFAQRLMKINPQFDKIEKIDDDYGRIIIKEAVQAFGPQKTYLFSLFNDVAFSKTLFQELENQSKEVVG